MLTTSHLSFAYGATTVVRDVSISIAHGALVGILGPNGSGKTTLLRLLSGSLLPTSGDVQFDKQPLKSIPRRALAQRMAVVPQDTHVAFDYTALELVLMGRYAHLGPFEIEGPEDLAAADAALAATGTRAFANRAVTTLSGGERQRVAIASALAQLMPGASEAPETDRALHRCLFLDEPTASLDLRYQLEVDALVKRLHRERGMTIVLTTHDLRFATSVCEEVVLLSAGGVLAYGAPRDVLTPDTLAALYEIDAATAAPLLAHSR